MGVCVCTAVIVERDDVVKSLNLYMCKRADIYFAPDIRKVV